MVQRGEAALTGNEFVSYIHYSYKTTSASSTEEAQHKDTKDRIENKSPQRSQPPPSPTFNPRSLGIQEGQPRRHTGKQLP